MGINSAAQRRAAIVKILSQSEEAVSASALAAQMKVSRQIVVGDVALLRAAGEQIIATPRGYLLEKNKTVKEDERYIRTIACKHHLGDALARELYTVVDNGGELLDVIVEHPLYGQLSGPLKIRSRYDAKAFLDKVEEFGVQPLAVLTDGIHLHTLACDGEDSFQRITQALAEQGILLEKE